MIYKSLWAFGLGYIFGAIFFIGFYHLLFAYSRRTLKSPPHWVLFAAQWIVMPLLVAIGGYLAFCAFDRNALLALGGYVVSRLMRYLSIQRGDAMSNEDILSTIQLNAIMETPEGREAVEQVLSKRDSE